MNTNLMNKYKKLDEDELYSYKNECLDTQNYLHGFFGTLSCYYSNIEIKVFIWNVVFYILSDLTNHKKDEKIREFLDSSDGRYFAYKIIDFITNTEGKKIDAYEKVLKNYLIKLTVDAYDSYIKDLL